MKQENKYSLPIGTKRYRVEFCDEKEAIRLASQEGWTQGESLWDYLDPLDNDAHVFKSFKTLDAASRYAKSISERDVFKTPSIDEIELSEESIGRFRQRGWEITAHWLLDDGELVEAGS